MEKKDLGKILKKSATEINRSQDGVLVVELVKTEKYSIAYGELLAGEKNKKHKMEMEETYYFLEGKGELIVNDEKIIVEKDIAITIKPGSTQKLINTEKISLKFLMVVSPPYDPTKEEILE
jgi:mannose-6-phosphate isomerase-like protein (cupin superfamily)